MRHVRAFSVKLVVHALWGWVLFDIIYRYTFTDAIIIAVLTGILLYLFGDWFILRKLGNLSATLMDTASAFALSWLYLYMGENIDTFLPSLFFALGIGVFELIFHEYLTKSGIIPDERPTNRK